MLVHFSEPRSPVSAELLGDGIFVRISRWLIINTRCGNGRLALESTSVWRAISQTPAHRYRSWPAFHMAAAWQFAARFLHIQTYWQLHLLQYLVDVTTTTTPAAAKLAVSVGPWGPQSPCQPKSILRPSTSRLTPYPLPRNLNISPHVICVALRQEETAMIPVTFPPSRCTATSSPLPPPTRRNPACTAQWQT